jgi:DNA-binding GntR family transcriptional regulator
MSHEIEAMLARTHPYDLTLPPEARAALAFDASPQTLRRAIRSIQEWRDARRPVPDPRRHD